MIPRMSYRVELDLFCGPLDLLLYLVRRNEVDVLDLPIARITAQFNDYLEVLQFLDLDSDSDDASIRAAITRLRSSPPGPLETLAEPLRPYVSSLAPLLGKERVLTALPFAFEVR